MEPAHRLAPFEKEVALRTVSLVVDGVYEPGPGVGAAVAIFPLLSRMVFFSTVCVGFLGVYSQGPG
eukprot:CAMPEP_0183473590 /NCGR_PEP_ID=MMETSP0370-20130417/161624_1 /TAXON_ID=268820 /ORGANISM="Peridinium aciculiferum, Strain PAER-2" /LENGTH=65 /DNA_ID=CAMNT_0025666287 /DNA_START=131 /DNA_END=325 /DNA_ORIENTATION=+